MHNCKAVLITVILVLSGVLAIGGASPIAAQEGIGVNCGEGEKLQDAIDAAFPEETILVTGRCNENIRIDSSKQALTIDGQGSARIIAADANTATVSILGRGITIQNFRVIRGGSNGIRLSDTASATIKTTESEGHRGRVSVSKAIHLLRSSATGSGGMVLTGSVFSNQAPLKSVLIVQKMT